MRHLGLIITVWVSFYCYSIDSFVEKLNTLPKETVENSIIILPRYTIIYWKD